MLLVDFLLKVVISLICYDIGQAFNKTSGDSFSTGWISGTVAFACMNVLDGLIFFS